MLRLLLVVLPSLCLAAPPAPWTLFRVVDGLKVELRDVSGSHFEEIRVTAHSRLPLPALCDAVWGKGAKATGDFKKRVVISESETERWTYEQIRLPVVSDRDCVMHVELLQPAESGRCEVRFRSAKHKDYPPALGHERVGAVRGQWTLVPDAKGEVDVTYVVYSEPGGAIPPLFAKGGQRDAAVSFMKQILKRAEGRGPRAE